jgi:hypothetical protein
LKKSEKMRSLTGAIPSDDVDSLEECQGRKPDRPAVLDFLRSRGYGAEDAEDLTQEVFKTLLESDLLSRADQAKGRFRCLVIGLVRNVLKRSELAG